MNVVAAAALALPRGYVLNKPAPVEKVSAPYHSTEGAQRLIIILLTLLLITEYCHPVYFFPTGLQTSVEITPTFTQRIIVTSVFDSKTSVSSSKCS
jgi:hypothetical protein